MFLAHGLLRAPDGLWLDLDDHAATATRQPRNHRADRIDQASREVILVQDVLEMGAELASTIAGTLGAGFDIVGRLGVFQHRADLGAKRLNGFNTVEELGHEIVIVDFLRHFTHSLKRIDLHSLAEASGLQSTEKLCTLKTTIKI